MSQLWHSYVRDLIRLTAIACFVFCVAAAGGCKPGGESANWLLNGLLDPTQQGQFLKPRRNEIRASLSILEEPVGIQDADDPRPEDLVVEYRDHRIMPGDVLSISIFELLVPGQASTVQVLVSTSGFESLPTIGRVRLAGFTLSELEMELKAQLREADILPDPEVQVSLISTRATRFSIMGSVPRAGSYEVPHPDYRLLQALADAGGISPIIQRLYVFRKGAAVAPIEMPAISPNSQPANMAAHRDAPLLLSDASAGASSGPATTPASAPGEPSLQAATTRTVGDALELPATNGIDELEILERGPTQPEQSIIWDAEKGWVITPVEPSSGGPDSPDSVPASSPGEPTSWVEGAELASSIRIIEVPTKELLAGDPRYNIVIRPFDLISIPPGVVGEFYMMGNIARPGAYDITGRRLTVKEAIASAGGFGPLAWPSRADLIRRISQDEEQIIQLDLDAIFAGNAPDFYLRPNDIVNVGTTAAAPFLAVLRNAFRFSYGLGFVYDRNFADVDTFQARLSTRQFNNSVRAQQGLPLREFSR